MEEDSQSAEFRKAKAEGRQPNCVHCGEHLDSVGVTLFTAVFWNWDKEAKRFFKWENDADSGKPQCENCERKDWDFVDNGFIEF